MARADSRWHAGYPQRVTHDPDTRTMRQRMEAGDLYIADDPEIAEAAACSHYLIAAYNETPTRQGPLRRRLLEELLGATGEGTGLRPPLSLA